MLIAYEVYRGPNNEYGKISGTLGRSEFGLEIIVAMAHLGYVVGLSFDKVCALLDFFQNLKLRKSQIDASLNQLSRRWEAEFETLCKLLAHSVVVQAVETSWSINIDIRVRTRYHGFQSRARMHRRIHLSRYLYLRVHQAVSKVANPSLK